MLISLILLLKILLVLLPVLIGVAYLTLAERKILAVIQRRKGPNIVGILGLLQPFADVLKLLIKEIVLPNNANLFIFLIAPVLTIFASFSSWAVIPFKENIVLADLNIGLLYTFAISSLGVYGIICSGWASNSKYSFLGALRSAAQMISYEVSIGLILISVLLCSGSLSYIDIILHQQYIWYIFPLFPLFILFFISSLAETNRPPFDLPEAEAELVAGYFTEYSGIGFGLFYMGEYANIILMSILSVIFFLGGWWPLIKLNIIFIEEFIWFSLKLSFIIFSFIWVRAAFPRYRYDQLMRLGWKVFLPLSLGWVVIISGILLTFDILP